MTLNPPGNWISTENVYDPDLPNVAVVFFDALAPLELNVTTGAPQLGADVIDQVYVKVDSPATSALNLNREFVQVVLPVDSPTGLAAAAVVTVGVSRSSSCVMYKLCGETAEPKSTKSPGTFA